MAPAALRDEHQGCFCNELSIVANMLPIAVWIAAPDGSPLFANDAAGNLPARFRNTVAAARGPIELAGGETELLVARTHGCSICVASVPPSIDEERARVLYSLSAAEARVASVIATGRTPRQIAGELGVSLHTVRTHLKNLFAKTGTAGQNDLVARLNAGIASLRLPTAAFTQLGDSSKKTGRYSGAQSQDKVREKGERS
jgi:DNA-binding CsgD family transcriptional regulator